MTTIERRIGVGLGVVIAALGVATFFSPGLGAMFSADEFLLTIVGIAALGLGVYIARDRWFMEPGHARTGDPELIQGIPTPGEGFDRALRSASSVHEISGRETVTERLEAVGVTVLQRRRGYTESEARERLESGEWTDDPVAAAFFDGTGWAAFPLSFRLRVRLGEESRFGLKARRAAEELERIWTRTEDTDE
ncbi:DUF7269 family protein [Natranaeroarchaeum sulfidigenes]|uniref:Putative membrane protein n=1 Tax=Natranaeroarchaeum sulfidigenes TaxID=2784880 RepID=A0A897MPJ1_9EURY|nr:hypothetical protein [Natranaeroarchaeum sulfidigenes]QSG02251.1 putative membrane protein [Natranaeroarchaeum sulfidigenes]